MTSASLSFPHLYYAKYILEPGFTHAQELLFEHMMDANQAQALMLADTDVLPPSQALAIVEGMQRIRETGADGFSYSPSIEDLFFAVEGQLIQDIGVEAGGNLQIARSRNDLAAGLGRMMLRERLLSAIQDVLDLRSRFIDLIETHIESLMPGITHTQPAQPTTLAHYLLGVLGPLERDTDRLLKAFDRVNQSPLGVAAFTTTSFPIDRELTAKLLGFNGVVENGYDAVGANDHLLEAMFALQNCVGSLSRFVQDLLIWARLEVGILRIGDEFIQISSIMPQKRNPVVLEHIKIRIGYVYGDASTVATMVHNAAFGDTNDVEDQVFVPVARGFAAAESVFRLLRAVLETASFNTELLRQRAYEGNMTTTALADGLVRDFGLSFRSAHEVASKLVSAKSSFEVEDVRTVAQEVSGNRLDLTQEWVDQQLDPRAFVEARGIAGGPAPTAVQQSLHAAQRLLREDAGRLNAERDRLLRADELRRAMTRKLSGAGRG